MGILIGMVFDLGNDFGVIIYLEKYVMNKAICFFEFRWFWLV